MDFVNTLIAVSFFVLLCMTLAILIYVCSKLFYVKEDPRVDQVMKYLPNINCGACGYPGCNGLANAIVKKGEKPRLCKPIKKENIDLIEEYIEKTTGPNGEYVE